MSFDSNTCTRLRQSLKVALAPVEEHLGCKFNLDEARITYTDGEMRFKLVATDVGEIGPGGVDQALWDQHCGKFDLSQNHFGQSIQIPNKGLCDIIGIRPSAKKTPVIVLAGNGKKYTVNATFVNQQLGY